MYAPKGKPNALVLFVSGDGGWQFGVINMAKFLAAQGALRCGDRCQALCYFNGTFKKGLLLSCRRFRAAQYGPSKEI
ncbi:hypothetical protein [Sphingobacterium multivorum]|uniref:hypothetical protein n=1 Tax=Sphingobacterium multivorum TaxID=28454 RepID=UPI001558EED4|nr:hypothetical protein [Sphingobacterium multivorum]